MRLLEVIQRSTSFLEARGVESPRLQVEWMLAHTLRIPRLQLYLQFDRILDAPTLDTLRTAVQRRGQREPLQHILGTASFCGLELEVCPDVLIPRPETELLAEHAWTWLNRAFPSAGDPPQVLDWGTGSGCLAIAIAAHHVTVQLTAVDVSAASLAVAQRNVQRHGLSERIHLHQADGTETLAQEARFHLIVANPPYIPTLEIAELQPEVRDFDPRLALDGGPDGLNAYRHLAGSLRHRLHPGGAVMLEFGDNQATPVSRILSEAGWSILEVRSDHSGRDRFLVAEILSS